MFKAAEHAPGMLLAVLILAGCAVNDLGDSVSDTRTGLGYDPGHMPVEDEFPGVARNCQIPAATVTRMSNSFRLNLPADVYAARDRSPAAGRISCITHWARERGVTLTVAEAG